MALLDRFVTNTYDVLDGFRFNTADMPQAAAGRIAVVGLPGVGKKTLCNSLWGWDAVQANGETTRSYGLLTLIDLPLDPYEVTSVMYRLENTDLIVFVLDGKQGLDADSFNWIARLRSLNAAMLVVLNKVDVIPPDKLQPALEFLEARVARPVIPVKAIDPHDVREHLLAGVLHVCPDLAVPLATEMPSLRYNVAQHTVMQAMMNSVTLQLETNPRQDSAALVGLQMKLVRQIASIYGYKEQGGVRQRLGLSVMLRWLISFAVQQAGRLQQLDNRITGSVVSVASTFLIGRGAMLVYGGHLPRWFNRYTPQAWRSHASVKSHAQS